MADENGSLGLSVRHARKRRGLTIQQVADISQLSISFISQLERGLVSPSVNSSKISRALGMQIGGFSKIRPGPAV
jgi:transcriptional regulator with XRE-family HTH domain